MDSNGSDPLPAAFKILIAGGFGAGKTTLIGAVSEIEPLTTEETLTLASVGTDSLQGVEDKSTTTVAMDFGRITFAAQNVVLYLFGTPGQERFWFLWNELCQGVLGAVVLVDTRRVQDCFAAVEFFESRGIPFLLATNEFDGTFRYEAGELRDALDLRPHVPIVSCDARETHSAASVLISLIQQVVLAPSALS